MSNVPYLRMHPGHDLTVTRGPFGRSYVDCSCGLTRVCASGYAANRVALIHHHDAGGCNCPEHVVADPVHPTAPGICTSPGACSGPLHPTVPGSSSSRPAVEQSAAPVNTN